MNGINIKYIVSYVFYAIVLLVLLYGFLKIGVMNSFVNPHFSI